MSWVYVAEAKTGQIKIGVSANPDSRVMALSSHSPVPVRMIAKWPGKEKDEQALHRRYEASRSHSEWFHRTVDVETFVEEVYGRGVDKIPDWKSLEFKDAQNRVLSGRARQAAAVRALWQDPEWRERTLSEMRKTKALFKRNGSAA